MRLPIVLASLVLVALASHPAHATEASAFEGRRTAVYGELGLGAPLGLVGVELEHTLASNASISAGFGMGAAGPQAATMLRGLFGGHWSKFVIGGGVSGGRYQWNEPLCFEDDCAQKSGNVGWGNLEIGGEHRFRSGFAMKYFAGYGHIIRGDLTCDDTNMYAYHHCMGGHVGDGYNLVYTGIALGYAF